MNTPQEIGEIAVIFLVFRDQLKLYHWMTSSYARHKAADKLVESITSNMDKFIETIQGSRDVRLELSDQNTGIRFENASDSSILKILIAFKNWLSILCLEPSDKDLSNIRDDILCSVNQTIYLFSLH